MYDRFHWKCYPPEIHQIEKLKFLGTDSNSTKISIWICTKKFAHTWVLRAVLIRIPNRKQKQRSLSNMFGCWFMITCITWNLIWHPCLRVYVAQIHVDLSSRVLAWCFFRNRTDDFGVDSPSPALWPTELVLHRLWLDFIHSEQFSRKQKHKQVCTSQVWMCDHLWH